MAFDYFADPSPPFLIKCHRPVGPDNYGPTPPRCLNVASNTWVQAKLPLQRVQRRACHPTRWPPLGPLNGPLVTVSISPYRRPCARRVGSPTASTLYASAHSESPRHAARAGRASSRFVTDPTLSARWHCVGRGTLHSRPEISFEVTPRNLNSDGKQIHDITFTGAGWRGHRRSRASLISR